MQSTISRLTGSKSALVLLVAAVALAVVATGVGYAAMTKNVTMSVDGEARDVNVLGDTVGDALASEGIEVGDRDVVAPGVDSPISDGSAISVKFARPLDVTVDGDESRYWVTATEVSTALEQLDMPFAQADLSASRGDSIGREGLALEVVTPKSLTVKIGAKKARNKTVTALTVSEALDKLGVKAGSSDKVKPGLGHTLEDGDRVVFTDVKRVRRTARESIGFATHQRTDSSMYRGESRTVRAGRSGTRKVVYRVTLHNGKAVRRAALKRTVLSRPVDAITKVGTKTRPAPTPAPAPAANYAGGSTVWDQLAQCESGGNWAINTGNGYYGGLQFNASTWQAYGGSGLPHQSSRETQIAIASKLRDANGGYGAWPGCSSKLGLPR